MTDVGFIGVGAMGSAIASRLVDSHRLFVNDRVPAAAEDLVERGATFATPDEIATTCRFLFTCLPRPTDVSDLLLGQQGMAQLLAPGSVVIDNTTGTPPSDAAIATALAERDVDFVDAPIGGGVRRARAGTATLMVGGTETAFAKVRDLLMCVTPDVFRVGEVGAGHAMKLVNNFLNNCNRFAALEAVALGEASGLDRATIIEVLNKSTGRNYTTEYTYPQLLLGDTYKRQGFTLGLMRKDIRLANELAKDIGIATSMGAMAEQLTDEAIDRFGEDADQSQMMAQWYEPRS